MMFDCGNEIDSTVMMYVSQSRESESESVSGNQGAAVRVGASLPRLEPSTEEYSTPRTLRIPLQPLLLSQQPPTLLIKAFHGLFISGKCRSWTERVEALFSGNKRARCVHNLSLRGHTKGEPLCRAFWRVKRTGRQLFIRLHAFASPSHRACVCYAMRRFTVLSKDAN